MVALDDHFSAPVCQQDILILEHLVRRVITPFRGPDRTSQCYENQIERQIVMKLVLVQILLSCVTKQKSNRYQTQIESLQNSNRFVTKLLHMRICNVTKASSKCYETRILSLRN